MTSIKTFLKTYLSLPPSFPPSRPRNTCAGRFFPVQAQGLSRHPLTHPSIHPFLLPTTPTQTKKHLREEIPSLLKHKASHASLLVEDPFDPSRKKVAAWAYRVTDGGREGGGEGEGGAGDGGRGGGGGGMVRNLMKYVGVRGGGGGGGGGEGGGGKGGGEGRIKVYFRGAPDVLLDECEYVWVRGQPRRLGREERQRLAVRLETLCGEGLRVLGFALTTTTAAALAAATKGGENMTSSSSLTSSLLPSGAITGFLAFQDPVRAAVAEAIHTCRDAGIRVVMLTGDHQLTACSVARQVGILPSLPPSLPSSSPGTGGKGEKGKKTRRLISSVSMYQSVEEGGIGSEAGTEAGTEGGREEQYVVVCPDTPGWQADTKLLEHGAVFCRASPYDKLALLQALQREGGREGGRGGRHVVAVTGDGANDALSLAAADVGMAMGRCGSRGGRGGREGG